MCVCVCVCVRDVRVCVVCVRGVRACPCVFGSHLYSLSLDEELEDTLLLDP